MTIRTILVLLCLATAAPAFAQAPVTADLARPPEGVTLCGEKVPLELDDVRERFEKEMLLILWNRPQVLLWLKRTTRFLPFIAQELKTAGLPEDLQYLPIVESALLPHIGSARGALGFWQLMPETARNYGLTVDEHVDHRRDLFLSTPAALSYLKQLNERFSSWALAMAAYNMGEEGLDAEILEQKTKDYYQLYLSLETQQFVLRVLAVKLIVGNPAAYGFELAPQDYYPPLRFETAALECFEETPLRLAAEAASTSFKTIKDLNPHVRGYYLQAGNHELRLPPGAAKGFAERFQELAKVHGEALAQRIYVVQQGDSLSTIAARFEVPLKALLIWNKIDMGKPIHPGKRLVIFPRLDPDHPQNPKAP
jgi:membrane-bound lytic murein transglycosylase D